MIWRQKMNQRMVNDILNWANEKNELEFRDFIIFMNDVYENKHQVEATYLEEHMTGKIQYYLVFYNKRFPDFDVEVQFANQDYGIVLSCITMKSIKKISDKHFEIIDKNGNIYSIKK